MSTPGKLLKDKKLLDAIEILRNSPCFSEKDIEKLNSTRESSGLEPLICFRPSNHVLGYLAFTPTGK